MYKFDGIHPSKKGANRLSQYLAKQLAITRKELSIPRSTRPASRVIVTKKPYGGYGYRGERQRHKILFRPPGDFPQEPTYGTGEKDVHRPRTNIILRKNTTNAIKHLRVSLTRDGKIQRMPKGQRKNFTLKMKKKLSKSVKRLEGLNKNMPRLTRTTDLTTSDIRVIEYKDMYKNEEEKRGRKFVNVYHNEKEKSAWGQNSLSQDRHLKPRPRQRHSPSPRRPMRSDYNRHRPRKSTHRSDDYNHRPHTRSPRRGYSPKRHFTPSSPRRAYNSHRGQDRYNDSPRRSFNSRSPRQNYSPKGRYNRRTHTQGSGFSTRRDNIPK